MAYQLLKGKKGIIFGALDEKSLAWRTALRCYEEGAELVLTNAPVALRMGEINKLAAAVNAPVIGADVTSLDDLKKLLTGSMEHFGGKIDFMFWTTTVITMFVFFITQIILFGFLFKYRGSDKRKGYFYPHNNTIEKVWTIIPAIVLTILVVFGFFTWRSVTNTDNLKGDINIDITGHQFAWEIRYPGKDGKLGQVNYQLYTPNNILGVNFKDRNSFDDQKADTIVLPVNREIRINIHAQDVIHSVYMPHFRVQMNAVPGLPTFFKFTPTITTADMRNRLDDPKFEYSLYCNKICGGGHYNMQKVVRVVSEGEYENWIARQKPYLSDQIKKELHLADAVQPNKAAENRIALNN